LDNTINVANVVYENRFHYSLVLLVKLKKPVVNEKLRYRGDIGISIGRGKREQGERKREI
jgi:hypothetical protein